MKNKIQIQEVTGTAVADSDIEIVERKGLGHPDTICDLVMEHVSQKLYQVYQKRCGRILHYNCDKGLLVAGQVQRRYGGGRVLTPMRLVIGDRATLATGINVCEIATEAAKDWFRANFPEIDPDRHLTYQVELKQGSEELRDIFRRSEAISLANDTSAAVGYAPLSETERIVLETERFLNAEEFKAKYPETGRDVKVMGVRSRRKLNLTVAMPFLDRYVDREETYFRRKREVREVLLSYLKPRLKRLLNDVAVNLNTLDRRGAGLSGMYLSVLGTSAEDADSGAVGRGNQVNGIIALNRSRGSEAAAGKNPVSHVGKIYSVLTHLLAHEIYTQVPDVREVVVWLCSRIGDPVNQPQVAAVQVRLKDGTALSAVGDAIRELVKRRLSAMPLFCRELAQGKYAIC